MARSTEDRVLRSGDNRSHVTMEALDTGVPNEDDEKTTDDACGQGNSFSPLFLISEWNETFTTRKCLSVAVNLPSGTHQNYQLAIVDSGATLQLRVHWPAAMGDVKTLHHLWLVVEEGRRVSKDHAKLGGFEKALREKRTSADELFISTPLIRLPFPVETEINHEPLHWSDSNTFVLYIDLRAARDTYYASVGQRLLNICLHHQRRTGREFLLHCILFLT